MTTGSMRTHADAAESDGQSNFAIAEWVSGRRLGSTESGAANTMSNVCATHPAVANLSAPSWNGWSPDMTKNNRYQPAKVAGGLGPKESGATEALRRHGFSPAAVGRLEDQMGVWTAIHVFSVRTADRRRRQIFIGSDSGYLYSLDAATGCVHSLFQAQAGLRSTQVIGPLKRGASQLAAFFGDIRGNAYRGRRIHRQAPVENASRRAPARAYYRKRHGPRRSRLRSGGLARRARVGEFNHLCCTIRGLVAVLDASTGKTDLEDVHDSRGTVREKSDAGIKFLGPSGAGIWGPVTIDPKRQAVYVPTGNAFSAPDLGRANAVMAMDINTGKVLWVTQAMHGDVWHTECPQGPSSDGHPPRSAHRRPGPPPPARGGPARGRPDDYYCPDEKENPDWDFSAGTILVDQPNGRRSS